MQRVFTGFVVALLWALMVLPMACKPDPRQPASTATQPAYKPIGVTLDDDVPPPETDPVILLFRGLTYRDRRLVKQVLEKNPAVVNTRRSVPDGKGKTDTTYPILAACKSGSVPIVELLLQAKADLSLKGSDGHGALWAAVESGNIPLAKLLIARGLDPKALESTDYSETLLWAAPNKEMAQFLISLGIDPKTRDKLNDTALHEACRRTRQDVVELLLDSGMDIETPGHWGMRPLHVVASTGDGDPRALARFLLSRGANINSKGYQGQTPLHDAAFCNWLEMATLLLNNGADVMAKNDAGQTPMDLVNLAGQRGRERMINLLIKHGAPGKLLPLPD